ncbi:phage integrase family protein [Mycobacteroides abscessus subsp. massiliense]|uniref:tyrosine-type recombinase/integrase n=1 Tax=Mycobacteroides abscessus TaxID=36809 RepID=UPI0009A5ADB7|nr:site-specific integrase [Mycobacteroides abscessus]SKY52228.1 phage integrase family protein [Mycobacteroides abscessus subsp. massiliense]SKZ09411.1 phage integrase family protein [Mycobacteroides abscessus subsp. massiliense]
MATRRGARAGVEDRWHRPARNSEAVLYPTDAVPGQAVWCTDPKHGTPGTLVCTGRHGQGQRWQARWVADGAERSKSFSKKTDADRHLRGVVADVETGTYADPQRSAVTFGTVAESWLKTKQAANRAPKTIAGYRGLLDVVILPKWRDERLRDVTHERLQDWLTFLATDPAARQHKRKADPGAGLSPARVIQTHQVVSQVLSYAMRSKYVATNAADHIELPSKPQSKDLALTHDQVHRLAEETASATVRQRSDTRPSLTSLAAMVRFLSYSGLRFGEAAALRVGDVDLQKRRVLVGRSITGVRGQGRVEGDTKTHQRRAVPILTTACVEELRQAVEGRDADEFLFPGPDGTAMTVGWFRVRFDKAVAALGLGKVTPHTLRHTAGSLALSEGASVATVQKLLGHRNATTTMNVYSHMLPDDFDNLAAAMDSATRNAGNVVRVDA